MYTRVKTISTLRYCRYPGKALPWRRRARPRTVIRGGFTRRDAGDRVMYARARARACKSTWRVSIEIDDVSGSPWNRAKTIRADSYNNNNNNNDLGHKSLLFRYRNRFEIVRQSYGERVIVVCCFRRDNRRYGTSVVIINVKRRRRNPSTKRVSTRPGG